MVYFRYNIKSCFILAGGGENGGTDVLEYDPVGDEWKTVGTLSNKRKNHAMSVVSGDIASHCISEDEN